MIMMSRNMISKSNKLSLALVVSSLLFCPTIVSAFAPGQITTSLPSTKSLLQPSSLYLSKTSTSTTQLWMSSDDDNGSNKKKKLKSGMDEEMTSRLVKETIAPWRGLRLFLYFSAGSGAALGGFITLTGTLAALSGARTDVDLNTEFLNLAIDFGAVAVFALLAKFDFDKKDELDERINERIEAKKAQKQIVKGMRKREEILGNLLIDVQISTDGTRREAPIVELQRMARQHMILVIGNAKACKDALIGANLLKMDFTLSNVLVVPYDTGLGSVEAMTKPDGKSGFGDRPMYETQPYVAKPAGDGWEEYIDLEVQDAIKQSNNEAIDEEGIAIVVASNGKVIRRGVGKVPWRQMVEQLNEEVKV